VFQNTLLVTTNCFKAAKTHWLCSVLKTTSCVSFFSYKWSSH